MKKRSDTDDRSYSYILEYPVSHRELLFRNTLYNTDMTLFPKVSTKRFYYVTDLHLEHQLCKKPEDIVSLSSSEIRRRIDDKITELFLSLYPNAPRNPIDFFPYSYALRDDTLLIGGDIANNIELEKIFYEELVLSPDDSSDLKLNHPIFYGDVISVLGNHELWDGWPHSQSIRSVDDIISDYRQAIPDNITILENDLFIRYKGLKKKVITEDMICNMNTEELTDICQKSTFLCLGGLGFSGLNPTYNAASGLYRDTVALTEDIQRAKRFRMIYEKVLSCAANCRVIVLTHTPMTDWSHARYNPKWIYVNGHTHHNLYQNDKNAIVLSDNQIGYKPRHWHLNKFVLNIPIYNPFESYTDGVYSVTREQYLDFNRCRNIFIRGLSSPGDIYLLKYNNFYMFVLKNKTGLNLLAGGARYKLSYDITYYYEHLPEYIMKMHHIFTFYRERLFAIAKEVKMFGGFGNIHGCIVDIDELNHIYLNPFDGKITPYFALNMTDKVVFDSVEALLNTIPGGKNMIASFTKYAAQGKLPTLSHNISKTHEVITKPQVVLDKSMYKSSRIMRQIQYFFDQNIIRIWNDDILLYEGKKSLKKLETDIL